MSASVVVCAYTEERWDLLAEAIASVEGQALDGEVQLVLVVDHNDALLERARARWPRHLVVANEARQGLSGARNTGVARAAHEVVAFLDDDAAAEPGWLAALASHFADATVAGVGGAVVPRWLGRSPGWFPDEFLWVVGCSYEGLPTALAEVRNPIGASMAFRRSVLVEVGGFSAEVGRVGTKPVGCEETELSLRAGALGYRVLYDPAAVVHHAVPGGRAGLRYFVSRCRAEGRSKAVVSRLAKASPTPALATEQAYVADVLPRGVARAAGKAGAIVLGLAATTTGYVEGRLRRAASVNPEPAAPPRAQAPRSEVAA